MKLIIAGGRDYWLTQMEFSDLDVLHLNHKVAEVVCGGANGVDACGKAWAIWRGIPVRDFPPDWDQFGKRAGILRNAEMAQYATALAVFNGGKGTAHMVEVAREWELQIFDFRK